MSDNEEISQQDVDRMAAFLEWEQDRIGATIQQLYPDLHDWVPTPKIEQAKRIIQKLLNDGFTPEQIAKFIDDEMADRLQVPGIAMDSVAFLQDINELAHIRYAISLGDIEGLRLLGGVMAVSGYKSATSHKNRDDHQDKLDFQKIAAPIFEANNHNITQTLKAPELSAYARKYTRQRTRRDWLVEIRPPDKVQKGRPKKR